MDFPEPDMPVINISSKLELFAGRVSGVLMFMA
jgi:hypothetical protein